MSEGIKPGAQRRVVIIKTSKHNALARRKGELYAELKLRRELFKAGFAICPDHLQGDADCVYCRSSRPIELTIQPSLDQKIFEQAIRKEDDPKMPARSERRGKGGLILPEGLK